MPLPFSGTALRLAQPIYINEYFEHYWEPTALDDWLASDDWGGWGRVVLRFDHYGQAGSSEGILAATNNGTLKMDKAGDFIVFEGELVAEGDSPGPSTHQRNAAILFSQELLWQVSMGATADEIRWEFDFEDEDKPDRMVIVKAAIYEVAIVDFGLLKDMATMRVEQSMSISQSPARLQFQGGGKMMLYEKDDAGRLQPMDILAARDKAKAEARAVYEAGQKDLSRSSIEPEPVVISADEIESIVGGKS